MFNNGWDKSGNGWHSVGSGWGNVSSKPIKKDDNNTLAGAGKAAMYTLPIGAAIGGAYWLYRTQQALIHQVLDTTATIVSGAAITSGILAASYAGLKLYQASQKQTLAALQIKPKSGIKINPARVAGVIKEFRQLYVPFFLPRVWLRWWIICDKDGKYHFKLICPDKHKKVLKNRLANAYPDCVVSETSADLPDFYNPGDGEAAHMKLNERSKERGLKAFDPYEMGDILALMEPETILEVMVSPSSIKPIRRAIKKKVDKIRKSEEPDKDLIKQIEKRNAGDRTAFDAIINVWGKNGIGSLLGDISGKTEHLNKLIGRPYRFLQDKRDSFAWDDRFKPLAKWRWSRLTDKELAPFFFLPHEAHRIWQYIPIEFPRPYVPDNAFDGEYGVGILDTDNQRKKGRIARLNTDTFTNHGLIAGASGGGKGSALLTFIKQDFLYKWINDPNSMGLTLCDPHTEGILLILSRLIDLEKQGIPVPWERVRAVSFGELGANHYPVAANMLHVPHGQQAHVDRIAEVCGEVILNAFDSSSLSQSVSDLERAFQGLLYADQSTSLLDIVRLFKFSAEGNQLRNAAIKATKGRNDVAHDTWQEIHDEIQSMQKDKKVTAIDTRLSPLIAKKSMQRFFCRQGNFFSQIPDFLANGDLVLIDFMGAAKEMYRLCASWLTNLYFYASQDRGTGGRPHLLIFDEVQKFSATDAFFRILTENRKFDLGLILITQEAEALDNKLKNSLKQNAGMIMSVRQSGDGARAMADLLGDPFTADELASLKKGREAALRSFEGKARLILDYPSFVWDEKETERRSEAENQAKEAAQEKFLELLARDHKPVEEADREIERFVYGDDLEEDQEQSVGFSGLSGLRRVK